MLSQLLRRLLWLVPTLVLVTILSFSLLSLVPAQEPEGIQGAALVAFRRERHLDLPRFFNVAPKDARTRAAEAARILSAADPGSPEAEAASGELARLGGAALPHLLPALDALAPGPRTRVALALAPVARRMRLPEADRAADPARSAAFWARFWEDRGPEFRASAVESAVRRLVRYGSTSRAEELEELDTFALPALLEALEEPSDQAGLERARLLVGVAAHVTGRPDRIAPDADLAEGRAAVGRWKRFAGVYGTDFVTLEGASRIAAVFLETRFGRWATEAAAHGLGIAEGGEPVLRAIAARAPLTLRLVFGAIAIAYAAGIALGAASAAAQGRRLDLVIGVAVLGVYALPVAAVAAALAPLSSGGLLLPTLVLALGLVAAPTRHQRASLLGEIRSEHVVAAFARGASRARALGAHALRVALIPVLTLASTEVPMAFGGAFVVEHAFGLEGLGRATLRAVSGGDTSFLMALSILAACVGSFSLLATDLAYGLLDPRIAKLGRLTR